MTRPIVLITGASEPQLRSREELRACYFARERLTPKPLASTQRRLRGL